MQRQRDPVAADQGVHGGAAGGGDPVVRDARLLRGRRHVRVLRIEEALQLGLVQVLFVLRGGHVADPVRVVQDDTEVAQASHARLGTDRRLTALDPRVAERALLRLARLVVEVDLLVRAAGHTHPPAAAAVLVDEDDAVLHPLVQRAGRTHRHARRIEAVLADPRQIEHERLLVLQAHLLVHLPQDRVAREVLGPAAQVVVPVRPPRHRRRTAVDQGARRRGRDVVAERRADQVLVVVRPRLVVVVQRGQFGVGEQTGQTARPAAAARHETAVLELPAALPPLLVLVAARIALAGAGLHVVEPHVLGARPVGPGLFAGDRAGVAADALVEVHDHRDLRHDPHQYVTSWARRRITVTASR